MQCLALQDRYQHAYHHETQQLCGLPIFMCSQNPTKMSDRILFNSLSFPATTIVFDLRRRWQQPQKKQRVVLILKDETNRIAFCYIPVAKDGEVTGCLPEQVAL